MISDPAAATMRDPSREVPIAMRSEFEAIVGNCQSESAVRT